MAGHAHRAIGIHAADDDRGVARPDSGAKPFERAPIILRRAEAGGEALAYALHDGGGWVTVVGGVSSLSIVARLSSVAPGSASTVTVRLRQTCGAPAASVPSFHVTVRLTAS